MFWTRLDRRVYRFIQPVEGRENSLQISQALDKQRHIVRLSIYRWRLSLRRLRYRLGILQLGNSF